MCAKLTIVVIVDSRGEVGVDWEAFQLLRCIGGVVLLLELRLVRLREMGNFSNATMSSAEHLRRQLPDRLLSAELSPC